jgi:glucokinase
MRVPVVVGLDFGGSKIAVAVSDLGGLRLAESTVATIPAEGAHFNLGVGIATASELLGSIDGARVLAVGAATFGIPGESGIDLAPAIPGWSELRLEFELRRAFPDAEVAVATDVKAAALAEFTDGALVGCDPGIYLNLGTGLAVAVVAAGTVISGRHGASGEIGYNLRSPADVGLPLSERLTLEDAVSGMGLSRLASVGDAPVTVAQVFAGAADDSRWAAQLVDDFIAELAFHLVNLTIAVDPARIVVGGGMTAVWDQLHGGLRRALDAAVPFPPDLMAARFPFDAPLRGAISLASAAAGHSRIPVAVSHRA